jgi:hypothetical protein
MSAPTGAQPPPLERGATGVPVPDGAIGINLVTKRGSSEAHRTETVDRQSGHIKASAADQQLIRHILDNHLPRFASAWELAVLQALAKVKGDLSPRKVEVLLTIWHKIQGAR